MAADGKRECKLLRAANAFRRGGEKPAQQVRYRLDPILARLFWPPLEIVPKGDAFPPVDLAILEPDEFQIVGQQDVVRQRHIALHLIRPANLIEVFADGLVLDITEDHSRLHDLEIRAGAAYFFRLVDDVDGLNQLFEPPRSREFQ